MYNYFSNNKGSALLIVLSLIALLTGVVLMSADRANTDVELSFNQLHEERAFYLAEAGLERATAEINKNNAWRAGYYRQVLEGGNYTVVLTDKSTNPLLGDTVVAQATAIYFTSSANVEEWLVPGKNFPFKYAAYGDKSLLMENFSCTDSYNSDSGTYAGTRDNINGDAGSNGTITLKNNITVGGDLSTATPGAITITNSADVVGDTTSQADPQKMNLVSDSDYVWAQANNSAPSGFVGTGYNYASGNFEVASNKTVSLKSGTYYFKNFNLKNNAKLKLEPGAQVKIFIIGDLILENNASFNNTGMPKDLRIFSKGTIVDIQNGIDFKGTIYAPNVDFVHHNNAQIYGAIIAKTVSLANAACIHYDRSLGKVTYGNDGTMVKVAWRQSN